MRLEYPTDNVDQRVLTVADTAGSVEVDQVVRTREPRLSRQPVDPRRGSARNRRGDAAAGRAARAGPSGLHPDPARRRDSSSTRPGPRPREVLRHVDVLKSDAVEAESLTGETRSSARGAGAGRRWDRARSCSRIATASWSSRTARFYEVPFRPRELRGRSGRGDTCLGSFLSRRLDGSPREAIHWAAALTSLKLEAEGRDPADARRGRERPLALRGRRNRGLKPGKEEGRRSAPLSIRID